MLGAKPVTVDLTKDFDLPEKDRVVKVARVAWLPAIVAEQIIRIQDIAGSDDEGITTDQFTELVDSLATIMGLLVVEWNLVASDLDLHLVEDTEWTSLPDAPLPIPSRDKSKDKIIARSLPMAISMYLIDKASEDDGTVPLASETESSDEQDPDSSQSTSRAEKVAS
jgi:hypothetical protein